MSSSIKKTPRNDLRLLDNAQGAYPNIARISSDRRGNRVGNNKLFFNDTDTYHFQSGTAVYMPARVPSGTQYVGMLTSSIILNDGIKIGIPDQFIQERFINKNTGSLSPFYEFDLVEQNRTSSYYLTGTGFDVFGRKFSSKLSSKTQVTIDLQLSPNQHNVDNVTFATSTLKYFSKSEKKFDDSMFAFDNIARPASIPQPQFGWDAPLYNAMGMIVQSGTSDGVSGKYNPSLLDSPTLQEIDMAFNHVQNTSCLINNNFAANEHTYISMSNYISAPFLLEKVVVIVPYVASSSWFNLRTTMAITRSGSFDLHRGDLGGPAVVFGLMRQLHTGSREVICSGTVIPQGDSFPFEYIPSDGPSNVISPAGFTNFGTPAVIIPSSSISSSFSRGVLEIEMIPSYANGLMSFGATTSGSFDSSEILNISPFGRTGNGNTSGRSFFKNSFLSPGTNQKFPAQKLSLTVPGLATGGDLFMFIKNEVSPYLLMPSDKIILFRATHRAIRTNLTSETLMTGSGLFSCSRSNFVDILRDHVTIKMYGSYIVEEQENNNQTLNQLLTSENISEPVGSEPYSDQFDVESKSEYYGSYISEFFTGSITAGTRGYITNTSVKRINSTGSFLRGVRLSNNIERYYDSMAPTPNDISAINGADIITYNNVFNLIQLGPGIGFGSSSHDNNWLQSYPFEPRYGNLQRYADPFTNNVSRIRVITSTGVTTNASPFIDNIISIAYCSGSDGDSTLESTYSNKVILNRTTATPPSVPSAAKISKEMALRAYYGIGDGYIIDNINDPAEFVMNVPIMKNGSGVGIIGGGVGTEVRLYNDVIIRGWKYGLINGLAYNSSAVFRKDRFGHMRDMLEQRQDTKFLKIGKSTVGSPIKIRFSQSDPADTFSSNLSFEATSSLPFFDGISRNRGDLPSLLSLSNT